MVMPPVNVNPEGGGGKHMTRVHVTLTVILSDIILTLQIVEI